MGQFPAFLAEVRPSLEAALELWLPSEDQVPQRLHAAMRYAVLAPGKRVRPGLVALGCQVAGGDPLRVAEVGAALEMVHAFSLVHDDLPALDDDDLRRGRPTVHRRFDEATAILAGDALLALAMRVVLAAPHELPAAVRANNAARLAAAVGEMIAGQVLDLQAEKTPSEDPETALLAIHRGKTGALLRVSLELGAGCALAPECVTNNLLRLGDLIGLLFQMQDDILDVVGTAASLGKTAGKDAAAHKLTYPAVFGLEVSRQMARDLGEQAAACAGEFGANAALVRSMIEYFLVRER